MITLEKLRIIGFTDFKHLKREDRDHKNRLSWTTVIKNNLFTIVLVESNDKEWKIDWISGSDEDLKDKLISMSLSNAIEYIIKINS